MIAKPRDHRDPWRLIDLTARGETIWSEMLISIRGYYEDTLAGFTMEECVLLSRLLDRLRDGLCRIAEPESE